MNSKSSKRPSLVKQLDADIARVERAFDEALGNNNSTISLSFADRKAAFCELAEVVDTFAANTLWSAHPLAAEMHEHAQRLQIACADPKVADLDVEWLVHLRYLLPMVRRELAHQLVLDPAEATVYLLGEFRGADSEDTRRVLGATPRALRAWIDQDREPRGLDPERLVLAAQLTADLRRSFSAKETLNWFLQPQKTLDQETPAAVLATGSRQNAARLLPLSSSVAIFAAL